MWVKKLLFRSSNAGLLLLFLVGCSDMHQRSVPYERPITQSDNTGYDREPLNLAGIHKWTLRPYNVMGKTYYPKIDPVGTSYEGIASWYGPDFHGNKTSSGEVYDMYDFSAAHKTLPMNTMIRVTNKYNKKSIVVRVNDRGPFVEGRIVDLSFSAGKKLGLDKTGIAPVTLEVLEYDAIISARLEKNAQPVKAAEAKPSPKPVPKPAVTEKQATAPVVKPVEKKVGPKPEPKREPAYFVQLGSFKDKEGAQKFKAGAAFIFVDKEVKISSAESDKTPVYKVMVGGFKNEEEARLFIEKNSILGARIALED